MADDFGIYGITKMHKDTGRMLRENNTYVNRADYIYNSHRDYYKKVLDFHVEMSLGNVPNFSVIHKFGRNASVASTFAPITQSGFYRTPTSNTALEILSASADDNATGIGARTIYYEGLKEVAGELVITSNTVTMNGLTPVTLPDSLIRLYRWYVATSGTYATQSSASHQGELTIRESGGGDIWSAIKANGIFKGQSQIGCYTVPSGYTALINRIAYSVQATLEAEVIFMQRNGVLNTTAPFDALRVITDIDSAKGTFSVDFVAPINIQEETDLIFMGKSKGGQALPITIDFEIKLVQNV